MAHEASRGADTDAGEVTAGINQEQTGITRSKLRALILCSRWQRFAALEERGISLFNLRNSHALHQSPVTRFLFPRGQTTFFTDVTFAECESVLIASALDMSIKSLDSSLAVLSSFSIASAPVVRVHFCDDNELLFASCADGVLRLYACVPLSSTSDLADDDSLKLNEDLWSWQQADICTANSAAKMPAAHVRRNWWRRGSQAELVMRCKLVCSPSRLSASEYERTADERNWISHFEVLPGVSQVKVNFRSSVLVFNLSDGALARQYSNLHNTPICSSAYLPWKSLLITASNDCCVHSWTIQPGGQSVRFFKRLTSHPRVVVGMQSTPDGKCLLMCFSDGFLQLLSIDTFELVHKLKEMSGDVQLMTPLINARFVAVSSFHWTRYRIDQVHKLLASMNAPVSSMETLHAENLFLVSSTDTSMRLVGADTGETYSVTTPPLRALNVRRARFDERRKCLHCLTGLQNAGESILRTYDCTTNPSSPLAVHEHVQEHSLIDFSLCDGEHLPPGWPSGVEHRRAQRRVHRRHSKVLLGLSLSGDLIVLDTADGMSLITAFNVDRTAQLSCIHVDSGSSKACIAAGPTVLTFRIDGGLVPESRFNCGETVVSVASSCNTLVCGGVEGTVMLLHDDANTTGKKHDVLRVAGHAGAVQVSCSRDGAFGASISRDGAVKVFTYTGDRAASLQLDVELGAVCFSPRNYNVYIGMGMQIVYIPESFIMQTQTGSATAAAVQQRPKHWQRLSVPGPINEDDESENDDSVSNDDELLTNAAGDDVFGGSGIDWSNVALTTPTANVEALEHPSRFSSLAQQPCEAFGKKSTTKRKKKKKKKSPSYSGSYGWTNLNLQSDAAKLKKLHNSSDEAVREGSQQVAGHEAVVSRAIVQASKHP